MEAIQSLRSQFASWKKRSRWTDQDLQSTLEDTAKGLDSADPNDVKCLLAKMFLRGEYLR